MHCCLTYRNRLFYKFQSESACRRLFIVLKRFSLHTKYLLAIIAFGCTIRILAALNNPAIEMDGIQYAKIAEAFSAGHFGEGLRNVFSPGYPLFIGLIRFVVPDVEVAGRLVSVVFGTLLIWLSFLLGKTVLKDERKALWLSFLVALHPYLVRYSGEVLSESAATFLFTLTILLFYVGWQKNSAFLVAASGLCLAFSYLTRPEYLIFYVPLSFILLQKKRLKDSLLLFSPLLVFGFLYILYLHAQTGLWIVSNKQTLSPFVSLSASFANLPVVGLCFLTAVSPLFFALAIIGFRRIEAPYRNLLLLLIAFHVLSLAFIGHATKRYSVEFVPICLIFSVEGIYVVLNYCARFFSKRLITQAIVLVISGMSLLLAYTPLHYNRLLQKKAGLFLLSHDPGSVIAARVPIAAFYAKGTSVDLLSEFNPDRSLSRFKSIVDQRRIKYLIVDRETEKEFPFLTAYIMGEKIVRSFGDQKSFIRIYRLVSSDKGE